MATKKKGQVTLRGRFPAGTSVRLVKVRDESVLRAEGGKVVATKTVGEDGSVSFSADVGGRYFVTGLVNGHPLEVRARGNAAGDESAVLSQPPITPDRTKLSDGTFVDEAPAGSDPGFGGVGPAPGQHQVGGDVPQRSATPRGYAHPVDPGEQAPYPRQEDVDPKTPQRSSTATGAATPIALEAPASQSEVKPGTPQRSDTPLGYATPIPQGDAVDAQKQRESAETKASVGEPVKAAASPPDAKVGKRRLDDDPAVVWTDETRERVAAVPPETVDTPGDIDGTPDTSGRDPQGQPLAQDVAAAAGVEPASSPSEPVKRPARKRSSTKRTSGSGSSKSSAKSSSGTGSRARTTKEKK